MTSTNTCSVGDSRSSKTRNRGASSKRNGRRRLGRRPGQGFRLAVGGSQMLQIDDGQFPRPRGLDHLDRLAVPHADLRPQRLVPSDHFVQRQVQGLTSSIAAQPQGQRHIVDGASRIQLIQDPQRFLHEGRQQFRVPRRHRNRFAANAPPWLRSA